MWHMHLLLFSEELFLKKSSDRKKSTETTVEIYHETNRPLIRPEINWIRTVFAFLIVVLVDVVSTFFALWFFSCFDWYTKIAMGTVWKFVCVFLVIGIVTLCLCAKRIVIFVIRIYQRYASYELRSQCLFVPNCSEYMVLAIQKYGLIKGIGKGMDRFHRCHAPNGGEDYP